LIKREIQKKSISGDGVLHGCCTNLLHACNLGGLIFCNFNVKRLLIKFVDHWKYELLFNYIHLIIVFISLEISVSFFITYKIISFCITQNKY
jgi:hypothetical protein